MWGSTSCASRVDALGDVALRTAVKDYRLVHRTAVDGSGTCTPAIKAHGTSGALMYSVESAVIIEGTNISNYYDVNAAANLKKNLREIHALSP
jgi:hypothetical protein